MMLLLALLGGGLALSVWGVLKLAGDARERADDVALPLEMPAPEAPAPPESAVPGGGLLTISSSPEGAMVLLDSELVGTTPLSLTDLASGPHTVTIAQPGYALLDTVVTVAPEQPVALVLALQARPALDDPLPDASAAGPMGALPGLGDPTLPPPGGAVPPGVPTGILSVVVRPWGTILIDDAVAARETDVRHEAAVAAGAHRVRAVHPVLGEREVRVEVAAGETAYVEIDLTE
jgi:hypothetical protein